jgi:hypothetical protein
MNRVLLITVEEGIFDRLPCDAVYGLHTFTIGPDYLQVPSPSIMVR